MNNKRFKRRRRAIPRLSKVSARADSTVGSLPCDASLKSMAARTKSEVASTSKCDGGEAANEESAVSTGAKRIDGLSDEEAAAVVQSVNNRAIEELTAFYEKKVYDLEQMLDISRSFSREIELGKLLEAIKYMCMAQMHVLGVDIFIRGGLDEADAHTLINSELGLRISTRHPLVKELFKERLAMTLDNLVSRVPPNTSTPVLDTLKPTLIVPIINKNKLGGIIFLGERIAFEYGADGEEPQPAAATYSDYEKSQVMSIATLAAVAISNASLVEKSSTDMMTRLKLKYYFFNILSDRLSDAMERNRQISVLMFDIDHFKRFNDTYGHECGDYVLITVASLIKKGLRDSDLASRYGGEEFTVMLDGTGRDEALLIANRIRTSIGNEKFMWDGQELHVTISCGVAVFDAVINPCLDAKALVDQADQGLYMSKNSGRNKVTYADPALLR